MAEGRGFFADLFDFSFKEFITIRIIKVIYILGLVVIGIGALFALVTGLSAGGSGAVTTLIFVPLGALLGVIFVRVYLELVVVIFRIGENSTEIARNTRGSSAPE